jgi:hypothetical protein
VKGVRAYDSTVSSALWVPRAVGARYNFTLGDFTRGMYLIAQVVVLTDF